MIRYYDASIEDATRIYVVEGDDLREIETTPEASNREIKKLPANFADWQQYTSHAYSGGVIVRVMSEDGA